eukprot:2617774-Amphidinium_carterae.1
MVHNRLQELAYVIVKRAVSPQWKHIRVGGKALSMGVLVMALWRRLACNGQCLPAFFSSGCET